MTNIATWLQEHGLAEYVRVFEEQQILLSDLPLMTEEDVRELGLPLGPRKRLLAAIRTLFPPGIDSDAASASAKPADAVRSAAERRQLTVMFCDLAGSTELARRLDPEDMQEINRAYQEACKRVIERYDGYIARYMGDGVLVYFGYPQAHEDDAVRAIHAGLGVAREVAAANRNIARYPNVELHVRVGIATGSVVVGDVIGEGASRESTAVGETPNLAARLQGIADPDAVVVGASTRALAINHFDFQDLGGQKLKGFGDAVSAWRVVGECAVDEPTDDSDRAVSAPLVGRTEELALILRRWDEVLDGEGQVVLLSGEPGIGKSRIVQAVRERLASHRCTFLRYQGSPYHTTAALWPFIRQLEAAAGIDNADDAERRIHKLESLVALSGLHVDTALPLVASLLLIETSPRYTLPGLSPQELKDSTLETLVDLAVGLSTREPVAMFFEDAHWSDPTSLELLDKLIARLARLPLLLVITHRPDFDPRWNQFPYVARLTLNRLSRRDVRNLVSEVTGGKELPDEVIAEILARTDGVPLYVEELTKLILESGVLAEEERRYVLNAPLPTLDIPVTLKASLMARLDRLGASRETAQVAAVIGREFSYSLLAAISPVPEAAMLEHLRTLVGAGMLFQKGTAPRSQYTFKHALVRDVAYESVLRSRRFQLHGRLADAIAKTNREHLEEVCESLAYHYARANQPDKAVTYLSRAAAKAARRYSHREAIEALKQCLQHIAMCDEGDYAEQRVELLLRLAQSHYFLGNFQDSVSILTDESTQAATQKSKKLAAEWFFWLSHMTLRLGMCDAAQSAAKRAIAAAEEVGALGAKGRALGVLVLHGHLSDAAERLCRAIDYAKESSTLLELSGEFYWQGMTEFYVGMVHIVSADFVRARGAVQAALSIGDRIEDRRVRAYSGFLSGWVEALDGNYERAIADCSKAIDVAPDPTSRAYASAFLGYAYLEAGDFERAEVHLRKAVDDFVAFRFRPFEGWFRVLLAESLWPRGQGRDAFEMVETGMAIAREVRYAHGIGWAHRCLARIYAKTGSWTQSMEHYQQAASTFEGIGSTFELGRTLQEMKTAQTVSGTETS